MTMDSKYKIADNILIEKVDDELLILNGMTQQYFTLDKIGEVFWELLNEKSDLKEVHQELTQLFDVEAKQLEKDLLNFSAQLEANEMIRFA